MSFRPSLGLPEKRGGAFKVEVLRHNVTKVPVLPPARRPTNILVSHSEGSLSFAASTVWLELLEKVILFVADS